MRYVLIPLAFVVVGVIAMAGFIAVCAGLAYLFVAYAGLSQADASVATQISLFVVILAVCGLAIAYDERKPHDQR